ncbi:hypothetical protein ACHAXS_002608 [Conticribra weissflogii]
MKLLPTMTIPFNPNIKNRKCAPTRPLSEKSELDTPFHVKLQLPPSSEKDNVLNTNNSARTEIDDSTCTRKTLDCSSRSNSPLPRDSAEMMHFDRDSTTPIEELGQMRALEEKLRACVDFADGQKKDMATSGAEGAFDDLYDDHVIHMMDGVAMNKKFLKALFAQLLKEGAKRSVEKFHVLDGNHAECVIRTITPFADILARTIMTIEDGKIIHVGKLENAKVA